MTKRTGAVLTLMVALVGGGCAAEVDQLEGEDLQLARQDYVNSINGLPKVKGITTIAGKTVINGLKTVNGVRTVNGLTLTNGLKTVNGVRTVNGIKTVNGVRTVNGLAVVEPDGLFSRTTGLMASNEGIITAKYMVRCALPATKSVQVKDYTGALITLTGEVGLAPTWDVDQCDKTCQEKLSACLMAFTNGTGNHVNVALAAHDTVIKTGAPWGWSQEAAFFGNLFFGSDEAEKGGAFYCLGEQSWDANSGILQSGYVPRFCQGYESGQCPFDMAFDACSSFLARNACQESYGAMKNCKDDTGRAWSYALTTYVEHIDEVWGLL